MKQAAIRALPFIGITLIAGGLLLLGVLLWAIWSPPPAPFGYHMIAEGKADSFPELGLDKTADFSIGKYEVRMPDGDKPVADFYVANDANAGKRVLLEWRNHITEFVVTTDSKASEAKELARAVEEHVPSDAVILGWWDVSRRLQLMSGKQVLFSENLARPVLIPAMWHDLEPSIMSHEKGFWKVPSAPRTAVTFEIFADALLSDEATGATKLRQLADGAEAYVVLHLSDAFKLGVLNPARFSIGYKDFSKDGQLHGQIRRIKGWIKENGHTAYTVLPVGDNARRVFFLSDDKSTKTLAARMLPFNTSSPFSMNEMSLVFQHGGYWVYRLRKAEETSNAVASGHPPAAGK